MMQITPSHSVPVSTRSRRVLGNFIRQLFWEQQINLMEESDS
jgi:hypothetical protein